MNPFLNKAQKKKFNRLDKEGKKAATELAIQQTVSKALAKNTATSIIEGMDLQSHHLYKKFVSRIDNNLLSEAEKTDCIEHLLSAIRTGHLNYVKRYGNTDKDPAEGVAAE